ncbi:MAG: MarR family transcriptional regulator [Deltaproteobacteria bacterium]|nr:MarR family transcriptional regulator [Deltaproteobacteria bacterium]
MAAERTYDPLLLENQLCFPLYACAKEVVRRYRGPLEPLGLTYTQYIVMMILWEHGGMTEGELGKIIHLDSGTLAPLLKRLEKQGLISRSRPADNERKLFLTLTEEGRKLKIAAETVPCAMENCIPLEEGELLQLRSLLQKVLSRMMENKA